MKPSKKQPLLGDSVRQRNFVEFLRKFSPDAHLDELLREELPAWISRNDFICVMQTVRDFVSFHTYTCGKSVDEVNFDEFGLNIPNEGPHRLTAGEVLAAWDCLVQFHEDPFSFSTEGQEALGGAA